MPLIPGRIEHTCRASGAESAPARRHASCRRATSAERRDVRRDRRYSRASAWSLYLFRIRSVQPLLTPPGTLTRSPAVGEVSEVSDSVSRLIRMAPLPLHGSGITTDRARARGRIWRWGITDFTDLTDHPGTV